LRLNSSITLRNVYNITQQSQLHVTLCQARNELDIKTCYGYRINKNSAKKRLQETDKSS